MKKQILLSAILVSLSIAAHAENDPFSKTRADANAERQAIADAANQRTIDQLAATQEMVKQLEASNKTNAEISAKLDKLIESSDANNVLMQTLLQRTAE